MKKFFISVLILMIIGGVAFFFGWVQFSVPPGEYGVIRSKTHGVDPEILQEGRFRWVWYRLLPTNVTIETFKLAPVEKPLSVKGTLPSGDTYASFAGVQMDFSFEVQGSFSFLLKPETLPGLMESRAVTDQASLDAYQNSLSDRISLYIVQKLQTLGNDRQALEGLLGNPVPVTILDGIDSAFPEVSNVTCSVSVVRFPDFELYESAKTMYRDYLARQRELLQNQVNAAASERINSQQRFDDLAKYGELITRYPLLLQFIAVEKGSDEAIKALLQSGTP